MIPPIGLSPNIERDDVVRAWWVLLTPWNWYRENAKNEVIAWFQKKYATQHVFLFASARSSLTVLLEAMHIGADDEVIIQAFTCMVVPNAIRFAGATPVYVDIDRSANCDPKDVERHITPKTKAIIVQHTFGTPADMKGVMNIAKKHHIAVIEDCAHALGATYQGKTVGTIGDAAFFSFGRDKGVSSVFGGSVIVKDALIANRLSELERTFPNPSGFWIVQQLLHPIITGIVLPIYTGIVGKAILVFFQKLHLLSFPVAACEKAGKKPSQYVMRYPNALALLLLTQLSKLDRYTHMRRSTASLYTKAFENNAAITLLQANEESSYLRFCICVKNQREVMEYAKKNGSILGNWYHAIIDPAGSNVSVAGYDMGSCKRAERLARECVNLPTRIAKEDAEAIIQIVTKAL